MNKIFIYTIIVILIIMGCLILLGHNAPINFRSKNDLKLPMAQNNGENHAVGRFDGDIKKTETQKNP